MTLEERVKALDDTNTKYDQLAGTILATIRINVLKGNLVAVDENQLGGFMKLLDAWRDQLVQIRNEG